MASDGGFCNNFQGYSQGISGPTQGKNEKGKLGANAMKRVAASDHLPTTWLFDPAKRPDDRADYCLDWCFLPQCKHQVLVFTRMEWGAPYGRTYGRTVVRDRPNEHFQRTGPPSNADLISLPRGKPSRLKVRTRDLWARGMSCAVVVE